MNRLPLLNPHQMSQLSALLALAMAIFLVWCAGQLYSKLRPRRPLVLPITESGFAMLLARSREAGSKAAIDPRIARTVFRYLREVQGITPAPLPGDHLIWDLGLSESHVEASLQDLARRLQRQIPFSAPVPSTVEDLAQLLANSPSTSAGLTEIRAA